MGVYRKVHYCPQCAHPLTDKHRDAQPQIAWDKKGYWCPNCATHFSVTIHDDSGILPVTTDAEK